MLLTIVQDWVSELEAHLEELEQALRTDLDFSGLEQGLCERLNVLGARVLEPILGKLLQEASYLVNLKHLGGRLAMRFKEYRRVRVRLANGQYIQVWAPYFLKARPKGRRRKRGPNRQGAYLGLEVLGFIGRESVLWVSEVVQLALLCPSLAVAQSVLARRGIELDVKSLRRVCSQLGQLGLERRGKISLSDSEQLAGQTLVIGIDGGRMRQRRNKRGRKKAGHRWPSYHAEWKEPKLFTIYLLDEQGQVIKEFAPLHDATMGDHEDLFEILERYLRALELSQVSRVVFCGDGAPWIWSGVEALGKGLGLDWERTYQVIDYTHAKQNLQEILDLLPGRLNTRAHLERRWKELLWQGDLAGLYRAIIRTLSGRKKQQALKKWRNYFESNQKRMQYAQFQAIAIPCGSGCVESAIRRVINLRLKAPGTFWTRAMAECFLFLRSQLISGRWDIFIGNIARRTAQLFKNQQPVENRPEPYEMLQAA